MKTPDSNSIIIENADYLFTFSAIIAPARPFRFRAETNANVDPEGNGTISFVLYPLSRFTVKDDEVDIQGGEEINEPIDLGEIPVGIDKDGNAAPGKFYVDLGTVTLIGDANPVTGADVISTMQIAGTILGVDQMCGDVTGDVTVPTILQLAGSTFAAFAVAQGLLAVGMAFNSGTDGSLLFDSLQADGRAESQIDLLVDPGFLPVASPYTCPLLTDIAGDDLPIAPPEPALNVPFWCRA